MAEDRERDKQSVMGRLITYEQYMNRLSERVIDNTRQLKRDVHQRRNGMEDLYGVCFTTNGDANHPATFYVSLSPDYVYLERFAFKFVIKPYTSSVAGASGGGISISPTELTVGGSGGESIAPGTSTLVDGSTGGVSPNPHTHSVSGSSSGLDYGVTTIDTVSTDWHVLIDGIDITAYLIAQHNGEWINGEGVYPNNQLAHIEDFYDILEVCDVLTDEGRVDQREQILASTFKKVQIASDAPFGCDIYLYLKYGHCNR